MMDGWTKYLISYDSTTRKGLFLSEEEINEYEQEIISIHSLRVGTLRMRRLQRTQV